MVLDPFLPRKRKRNFSSSYINLAFLLPPFPLVIPQYSMTGTTIAIIVFLALLAVAMGAGGYVWYEKKHQ
jgi:hypothetical protein